MFAPTDARQRLLHLRRWPERLEPTHCYESRDESEQRVEIWTALLHHFEDALDFWLHARGCRPRSDWLPVCRAISNAELEQEMAWLDDAPWVRDWRPEGATRWAMETSPEGEWSIREVLLVTDREYRLVSWQTTA